MYIGVYFCLSGFFLLLSLLLIRNVRKKLGAFLVISGALTLLGLAIFELSSNFISVIKPRESRSFNYAGDYLSQGILGWLIMIIPILGIFSSLVIALLINKRTIQSR